MKENVGKKDRIIRSLVGPALITFGYAGLGGNKGHLAGLASIMAGTLLTESAITEVCPVNAFFGINTRKKPKSPYSRLKKALV